MRLPDFESLIRGLASEIPAEFLEGVAEIAVSPRTVPHPDREGIWTLGECVPFLGDDGDPRHLQSRVVLYHGSFQALARDSDGFDWRHEAWETLTHEIRHHVEWKARAPDLEAYDEAAEANFARQDGEGYDPEYYRGGIARADGTWQVEDDIFAEQILPAVPVAVRLRWQGRDYEIRLPEGLTLPAFLVVLGLAEPPDGEFVLVLQSRGRLRDLLRRPRVFQGEVEARRAGR